MGSYVEVVLDCALDHLEFGMGVEIMLHKYTPPWIFNLISGCKGERESFHWNGVEFIVNWLPRCRTGNGCVHDSNLPCK